MLIPYKPYANSDSVTLFRDGLTRKYFAGNMLHSQKSDY